MNHCPTPNRERILVALRAEGALTLPELISVTGLTYRQVRDALDGLLRWSLLRSLPWHGRERQYLAADAPEPAILLEFASPPISCQVVLRPQPISDQPWCVLHQSGDCRCLRVARMSVSEREQAHRLSLSTGRQVEAA